MFFIVHNGQRNTRLGEISGAGAVGGRGSEAKINDELDRVGGRRAESCAVNDQLPAWEADKGGTHCKRKAEAEWRRAK